MGWYGIYCRVQQLEVDDLFHEHLLYNPQLFSDQILQPLIFPIKHIDKICIYIYINPKKYKGLGPHWLSENSACHRLLLADRI